VAVQSRFPPIEQAMTARAQFTVSSQVLPGFIVGLDTIAIVSAALLTYSIFVGGYLDDNSHYVAAVSLYAL